MPSSSMRLISVASVKRGGGSVKCWVASIFSRVTGSPASMRRQAAAVLVGLVVAALLIEFEKAGKAHDLAGGAQLQRARPGLGVDVDRGALQLRGFHLAGDGAVPDQLIELGLFGFEMARHVLGQAARVGGADRLMRFLRVLRLGGVFARRLGHEALAILLADHRAYARDRLRRHVDAVGSHIGDEAGGLAADVDAFIEPLRDAHGVRRRQPQFSRGLLLQRRGREGRVRVALTGFASTERL